MLKELMIALTAFGLTGCASVQIPPERLERSQASIRAAEEVGAISVPNAKLHLQLAREQTETAKKMADDGDERAHLMLARAEADSELALELAREVSVHADALKADEELKAVQARANP